MLVLAIHLPHLGVSVNGAGRWLGYGPLQFQPSELLKLALVLYTAALLARRPQQRPRACAADSRPLLLVIACACLLIVIQPDIGTAMVIAFTTAAHAARGRHARYEARAARRVVPRRGRDLRARPSLRARPPDLLHRSLGPRLRERLPGRPGPDRDRLGRDVRQSAPGQSVQKIFYLPAAQTDFILAVIAEELGVVGVCGLLCLYGLIAYAGLRTAKAARSLYGALVAVGRDRADRLQALLNAFAVLGLAPLTGVPLPLVSYGSSSMIVTLAAMGLLLDVAAGAGAICRPCHRGGRRSASRPGRAASPATPDAGSGRMER